MALRIAKGLTLPIHLVTESVAILAKRRAGKSTTARRLAEQLHRQKQQVVVVDPKGDWWGLLFARDGESAGLPFVVLGGEHGHVPLEVGAGELVARLVVTERVSVVLDLSVFRKHEVATFMTAFMETLYRLKAKEQHRTPVMLVIDEADAIAPQKPQPNEARMVGAASDLVRRGGQRGIGVTMITQRSAVLSKDLLTQIGILIVLRTIAPQDLKAIDAWIDVHGTPEQRVELMESLPSMPTGSGWVWAPGWPEADGIFQRCDFLLPDTYDSSATPATGEKRVEPKKAADVDLDAFKREMAATLERQKQDDPKALRAEIVRLTAQVDREGAEARLGAMKAERICEEVSSVLEMDDRTYVPGALAGAVRNLLASNQRPLLSDEAAVQVLATQEAIEEGLSRVLAAYEAFATQSAEVVGRLSEIGATVRGLSRLARPAAPRDNPTRGPAGGGRLSERPAQPAPRAVTPPADGSLTEPELRVLNALAWWESAGIPQPSRRQVAFAARYSVNGHFNNVLGGLRAARRIDYPMGDHVALTDTGRQYATPPPAPASRSGLIEMVVSVLRKEPQRRLFNALVTAGRGAGVTREHLAHACNYSVNGHFNNVLGSLKALGIVTYPKGNHVALSDMFEALR